MGCSKLSCYGCHLYFRLFRERDLQDKVNLPTFFTRGSHSKLYPGWLYPQYSFNSHLELANAMGKDSWNALFHDFAGRVHKDIKVSLARYGQRRGRTYSDSTAGRLD